jgi:hypothetical protein
VKLCRWILLLGLTLVVVGCAQEEEIKTYPVSHPDRENVRLFGAIVPHGDRTWFVKLSGPEAEVGAQQANFNSFVASLRFDGDDKAPLIGKAPEGWTEQPPGAMTYKAFSINADRPLSATISFLGKFDEGENTLDGNINRWRKQISVPPAHGDALAKLISRKTIGTDEAYLVDMTGMATFRKPRQAAAGDEHAAVHPPIMPPAAGPGAGASAKLPFRVEVPRGWEPTGAGQFGGASYQLTEGKERARVTIIGLAGDGGGILSNLKRWRHEPGQANLPPIPDDEVLKQAQTMEIGGLQAKYADFSGKNVRILGAILPLPDKSWFIKMTGPPELVGRHKSEFEAFIKSIRLD